ncbi:MAG: hypothetical protein CVV27_02590 [Candidatus Melainabacteria bacterium HGW-Melainabacteria-1]|nr:MAG: hypothetical protein CVV27_02590 [Candidatus Melainabacteria bacterium HGW-Melainabacteria-1]
MNTLDTLSTYIEELGHFYERFGLPKMAGRILGYLMASPAEHIGFDQITEQLQASKGSISGNLKLLLAQKLLEKYTLPGVRKSYYRFSTRTMSRMLEDKLRSIHEIASLFAVANQINSNPESIKHQQIAELVDFYSFLADEIPHLKQQWEQRRAQNQQET